VSAPRLPVSLPAGLSAATAVVGVIGEPVAHSLSPRLHNAAFAEMALDWVSVGFPVPEGASAEALVGVRALGIRGLSVTMPHKSAVAALLDHRTPLAERLGAVNCVANRSGVLTGDSTDGPGLLDALRRGADFDPDGRRCLVVGAGGAARGVIAALADAGAAEVVVVNRTAGRGEEASVLAGPVGRTGVAEEAAGADLVVNATPAGMTGVGPGTDDQGSGPASGGDSGAATGAWMPDPTGFHPGQVVVDLVYDPEMTPWLEAARASGARVLNGLGMLVHQAARQIEWWTGQEAPVDAMWRSVGGRAHG
jgi:shikimate dehydrogenase